MARARNLKPGFFKNEDLADCGAYAMLLFEGLWCQADREGRLEDRPRRLKIEILPYFDEVSVDELDRLLDLLADRGFIIRYGSANHKYIQVLKFHEHQNPHVKEAASTIPAPGEHRTSTVLEQDQHQKSTPDSLNPLTDSLNPNKDMSDSGKPESCPHEQIINLYHEKLPELQRVVISRWKGSKREKTLQARWRESEKHRDMEFWDWFFSSVRKNAHWLGDNPRGWKADLGWLLKRDNFDKVIERGASN